MARDEGFELEKLTGGGWVAVRERNPRFALYGRSREEAAETATRAIEYYQSWKSQRAIEKGTRGVM